LGDSSDASLDKEFEAIVAAMGNSANVFMAMPFVSSWFPSNDTKIYGDLIFTAFWLPRKI